VETLAGVESFVARRVRVTVVTWSTRAGEVTVRQGVGEAQQIGERTPHPPRALATATAAATPATFRRSDQALGAPAKSTVKLSNPLRARRQPNPSRSRRHSSVPGELRREPDATAPSPWETSRDPHSPRRRRSSDGAECMPRFDTK